MTPPSPPRQFHIDIDSPGRNAVEWLVEPTGLSKGRLKKVMQQGAVWLTRGKQTRRLRRASKPLQAGQQLHCYLDEKVLAATCPPAQLVEDCGDYSVWVKPRGMFSQGSRWGDHCTLQRWAELHLAPARNAFIVHRLDRATEGLMLLAHSKATAAALSRMFEQHTIHKTYRARVEGDFRQQPEQQTVTEPVDGKPAVSHVQLLSYDEQAIQSMLEVKIETGRKHQVRKHLAGLGFPIVGDRLHGKASEGDEDLQLKAWRLQFICPCTGQAKDYALAALSE